MLQTYDQFTANQNRIYGNFRSAHDATAVDGLQRDPGTEPQAAFLIAWRYPETLTARIEEISLAVDAIIRSVTYGPHNAHTTVSDYGLQRDLVIVPASGSDHEETLDTLVSVVRSGINASHPHDLSDRVVQFERLLTNGKTVVASGQANRATWAVNEAIKGAAVGVELKGSWGNHMTVNRFLEDSVPEDAFPLTAYLGNVPLLGSAIPTSIDVGYFQTDPVQGFNLTTYERFDLSRA